MPDLSGRFTQISDHLSTIQVERRTRKVRRPKADVLPLCYATNLQRLQLHVHFTTAVSFALSLLYVVIFGTPPLRAPRE